MNGKKYRSSRRRKFRQISAENIPVDARGYAGVRDAAEYTKLSQSKLNKLRMGEQGPPYAKLGEGKTAPCRYAYTWLDAWMLAQVPDLKTGADTDAPPPRTVAAE